jgi:hypothetical protein
VLVFVEDAAEAVASVDVEKGEAARVGDRFGQREGCQLSDTGCDLR